MNGWIGTTELADLAGISRQAANSVARRINEGDITEWQGAALRVKVLKGRRGPSGRAYVIKISSLPAFLKDRLRGTRSVLETRALPPSGTVKTGEAQVYWWAHHLRAALQEEDGSAARAEAIAALTEVDLLDWRQPPRPIRLSRSTIYRQLAKLEGQGLAGIGRKRRVDVGKPKVFISRVWDQAVPFDDATKAKIADNLRQEIRGLRAQAVTRHLVLEVAKSWLKKETAARGFPIQPSRVKFSSRNSSRPSRRCPVMRSISSMRRSPHCPSNSRPIVRMSSCAA